MELDAGPDPPTGRKPVTRNRNRRSRQIGNLGHGKSESVVTRRRNTNVHDQGRTTKDSVLVIEIRSERVHEIRAVVPTPDRGNDLVRLHLTLGVRQSWDEREATLARETQVANGPITPVPGVGDGRREFEDFSPSFVAAYDLTDDVNLYAKAVKGYKSGGFNVRASSIDRFNEGFDSETLWSYELGIKSEWLDDRLRLNVAGFISEYEDIQINVQSDPNNVRITDVLNAGEATVQGVEADLTLAPTPDLRITINYGYLDAQYDEIISATGADISSQYRFVHAPENTAAFDVSYDLSTAIGRISTNLNYTMQSEKYSAASIAGGEYIIDDYGLFNARLSLAEIPGLNGMRLGLWGRNLADEEYYINQFNIGRPGAMFGEPRTYGIDFMVEF